MGQSPFARRSTLAGTQADRRKSTRIDCTVPIVISGRDAFSHPFREATETISVSYHGAAIKTRNQILNGMHLTVENVAEGASGEAICVRVGESAPGQSLHAIAVQLVQPGNLWGVKNPPADWTSAAETDQPTPVSASARSANRIEAPQSAVTRAPVIVEIGDLDQRVQEVVDSALQALRDETVKILRESLKDFEDGLRIVEAGAQARMLQNSEKAVVDAATRLSKTVEKILADAEVSFTKLRRNLADQPAPRIDRPVGPVDERTRLKMALTMPPPPPPRPPADLATEKKTEPDIKK